MVVVNEAAKRGEREDNVIGRLREKEKKRDRDGREASGEKKEIKGLHLL